MYTQNNKKGEDVINLRLLIYYIFYLFYYVLV